MEDVRLDDVWRKHGKGLPLHMKQQSRKQKAESRIVTKNEIHSGRTVYPDRAIRGKIVGLEI